MTDIIIFLLYPVLRVLFFSLVFLDCLFHFCKFCNGHLLFVSISVFQPKVAKILYCASTPEIVQTKKRRRLSWAVSLLHWVFPSGFWYIFEICRRTQQYWLYECATLCTDFNLKRDERRISTKTKMTVLIKTNKISNRFN